MSAGGGPGGEVEALEAHAGRELDRLEALLASAARDPAEVEAAWGLTERALSRIAADRPAAAQAAGALGAWHHLVGAAEFARAAPLIFGRLVLAVEAGFERVARRLAEEGGEGGEAGGRGGECHSRVET